MRRAAQILLPFLADWYQRYGQPGGTMAEFVAVGRALSSTPPDRLFDDWIYTPGWTERVATSVDLHSLLGGYQNRTAAPH